MDTDFNTTQKLIVFVVAGAILLLTSLTFVSLVFFVALCYIAYQWDLAQKKVDAYVADEDALAALKKDYAKYQEAHKNLLKEVYELNKIVELDYMGVSSLRFNFGDSDSYKEKIQEVRSKQKEMISKSLAFFRPDQPMLSDKPLESKKLVKRAIQLTSRVFNLECNSAIKDVEWNNLARMEQRINKSFETINNLNSSIKISISTDYLNLKLDELRLAYEMKEKKNEEKEAQNEIRRQQREEQKANQEYAAALAEEAKLEELLASIQAKSNNSVGSEHDDLQKEIARLGEELKSIQKKNDRVKAMAEQTKLGYVYIISNIGSFGENVYKIGMTRRLDPMDRIKELGSASVPFYFDVHAMIFSEDAPALEAKIQNIFNSKRVNLINNRKEFFRVPLEEIKERVLEFEPNVEFTKDVEAREYKEGLALSMLAS